MSRSLLLKALLAWYVMFSVTMAIAPANRHFWAVASVLPVMLVGWLVVTHRVLPLSILSYVLITVYLTLHTIGVHYTYSQVPFGFWLGQVMEFNRNHFDRIVHFSFGFLLTYPLGELFRLVRVRGWLVHYVSVMTILGLSGFWEVVESWVAQLARPDLGPAVLGSQGDVWDAQKDITVALYGSLLSVALTFIIGRYFGSASEATDAVMAEEDSLEAVEELIEEAPAQPS